MSFQGDDINGVFLVNVYRSVSSEQDNKDIGDYSRAKTHTGITLD